MKYYWAIKSNAVLIHATTWMSPENSMLDQKSQSQEPTYCIIPFMRNMQNEKIYRDCYGLNVCVPLPNGLNVYVLPQYISCVLNLEVMLLGLVLL